MSDEPGRVRSWCENGGTEDGFTHDDRWDEVICSACGRALYLTKYLRLPRHLTEESLWTRREASA